MNTIFFNSGNSKISDPHQILLNLTDKINLKRKYKYFGLSKLSIYYTLKIFKKSCRNSKFKISVPTWNVESELPDGSYSSSYFNIILNISSKTLRKDWQFFNNNNNSSSWYEFICAYWK